MGLGAALGVGAVASIGGSILGASSQKKAAKQAAASQDAATQAQLQLGRESLDLNKQIYGANYNTLSPFVSRGNVAGSAINELLGLPTAPAMQNPLAPQTPAPGTTGGVQTNPVAAQTPVGGSQNNGDLQVFRNIIARTEQNPEDTLARINARRIANGLPPFSGVGAPAAAPPPTTTPPPSTTPPPTASSSLNNFANSAGMQFQLRQGEDAINNGYAAKGQLQSGAAMKELQDYGQQTALQNYFMPYMSLLGGQQATGAGAASSIAGVGANFGNTAAAINSGMGQNIQSGANAASNAALLRGQATSNMWSGIAGGLGGLFGGSSFGGF